MYLLADVPLPQNATCDMQSVSDVCHRDGQTYVPIKVIPLKKKELHISKYEYFEQVVLLSCVKCVGLYR